MHVCVHHLGQAQAAHALSSLAQESLSHSALARGALDAIGELAGGADKEAAKAAICTLNRLRLRVNPNPNPTLTLTLTLTLNLALALALA